MRRSMTYNELAELFKREGGDAQVCFGVISQNQILFGNNDTKKDIISLRNDEPIKWVKETQEEPVSEELEEASKEWLRPQLDKSYEKYGENKMMELTRFDAFAMLEAIEFGAKWKEEQFEKNRLKHCNSITNEQAELEQGFIDQHLDKYDRMPTFLDAIEYGMRLQKEQMMAKAADGVVHHFEKCGVASVHYTDPTGVPMAYFTSPEGLSAGDKVKILVIKQE